MRYVQRGPEPPELTEFKTAASADWTPRYKLLTRNEKDPIRAALVREQGHLCGYCGGRVGIRDGDCHIEHVEAQSTNPARALDYANMLASCQGSDAAPPVPKHCGAARGNESLPVTPFMPDCATYFAYGSDGRIEAGADPDRREAAEETIRALCLGVSRLKAARAAAIDGALAGLEDLSAEEWRAEAARYDQPDIDGRLTPFCFAIQHVLLSYA
jgi:uncharacterized protein (TIGR02646 family)